ncbi:MAG: urease accessory protein UreD [Granulosicoccus sp.]|nr:urease accessory protein UreD [Granulosicoccus sp.]
MHNLAVKSDSKSSSSWHAHMTLDFLCGPQRTFVKRRHSGPLTMQRAFYPEDDLCHVYLLHPPGGVVGGDILEIEAGTAPGTAAFVTTPGATKFYRSMGPPAVFNQTLKVKGGSLEWFPQENIFFSDANVCLCTDIAIEGKSQFMGWDIQVFGRRAGKHPFLSGQVNSLLKLTIDGMPILLDRLRVGGQSSLQALTGLQGNTVYGTLIIYPFDPVALDCAREIATTDEGFHLTTFDHCLLVRYLGSDSEKARKGFTALWQYLRKPVISRDPIVPRIWLT